MLQNDKHCMFIVIASSENIYWRSQSFQDFTQKAGITQKITLIWCDHLTI